LVSHLSGGRTVARRSGCKGAQAPAGPGLLAGASDTGGSKRLLCKKRKEEENDLRGKKKERRTQ